MGKYIDAEKLKRFVESIGLTPQKSADYNDGRDDVKMMVLDFIDSLQQERSDSPSLTERSIVWFENIAANAKRLSAGNVSHLGPTIVGMAIRSKEFLEKHKQEQPEVDLEKFISDFIDKKDSENQGKWCEEDIIEAMKSSFDLGLNARKKD